MADKPLPTKELRAMPEAELLSHVEKLQQELWQCRLKARDGSLQQTHVIPAARRQLARLRTILRERT